MIRVRPRRWAAMALIAGFALALADGRAPAQESNPGSGMDGAQELAVEGISKLLDALSAFVKSVPQYSAPEVLPNGDIILRRINPQPERKTPEPKTPAPPKSDDDPTTST